MSKVKGRATIELGLNQTKLDSGLKAAQAKFKKMGASIAKVGAGLAGIGASIVAPIALAAKAFAQVGDDIEKISARTGESARFISAMGFAAEQSGSDINTFEKALIGLERTTNDMRQGLKSADDAYAAIGLTLKDLEGLTTAEKFELIAERIREVPDAGKKAAIAMEIFGKSGQKLIPLLNAGAEGIARFKKEAEDFGIIISEEDAKNAAELTDSINILSKSFVGLKLSVGSSVAGLFNELALSIASVLKNVSAFARENKSMIKVLFIAASALAGLGSALAVAGGAFFLIAQILPFIVGAVVALTLPIIGIVGGITALVVGLGLWAASSSKAKSKTSEMTKEADKAKDSIKELNKEFSEAPAAVNTALTAYGKMNQAIVLMRKSLSSLDAVESIKEKFNLTDAQIAPVAKMASEWRAMGVSIEEVLDRLSNSPELSLLSDENRYSAFADTNKLVSELEKKAKLDEAIAKHGEKAVLAQQVLTRLQKAGVTNTANLENQYKAIAEATERAAEAEKKKNLLERARQSIKEDELKDINLSKTQRSLGLTDGLFSKLSESLKEAIADAAPTLALLSEQIKAAVSVGDIDLANKLSAKFKEIRSGLLGGISSKETKPKSFNFGQLAEAGSSAALKLLAGNDSPLVGLQKKANKALDLIQKQTKFAIG